MRTHGVRSDMEVRCPLCGVLMVYRPKERLWHCPIRNCRGVFMVPDPEVEPEYSSPEEMFRDVSRQEGVKGGKSGSSGRKRKKRKKQRDDEDPWRLK